MKSNIEPLQKNEKATGNTGWESWEVNLLLDCVASNQHIGISLQSSERALQSVIIGFDLTTSTLLLDTIYPCSELEMETLWQQNAPLVLSVPVNDPTEKLYYNLTVRITDIVSNGKNFMTEVKVESVDVSSRRRRDSRVHFDTTSRPAVTLVTGDHLEPGQITCSGSAYN